MTQYIVALTGGIGSGKSTVASIFASLSVPIVDVDRIAREVVRPKSSALYTIAKRFDSMILNADGSLNRTALRTRIFSNPAEKAWLNNLLHPLIQQQAKQQLYSVPAPYVIWVVPLLIENNLQQHANRVLVVDVDHKHQITRTISRDGVSRDQVENILAAQVSRQRRLTYADDVIDNSGCLNQITSHVTTLHQEYLTFAASIT